MERIEAPDFCVSEVFEGLSTNLEDIDLANSIELSEDEATDRELEYRHAINSGLVHDFGQTDCCHLISKPHMTALYNDQMAKKEGVIRAYYDKLLGLAVNDRCPFCRVGVVTTIDHWLPKSRYVNVGLTPINLVPCCRDCNSFKHVRFPKKQNDHFLHPYFDDFSQCTWLKCEVQFNPKITVQFLVDSNGALTDDEEERLQLHLDRLRLQRLFISNAMNQLVAEKSNFDLLPLEGDANDVRDMLEHSFETQQALALNSWQTALYGDLVTNIQYHQGGWREI